MTEVNFQNGRQVTVYGEVKHIHVLDIDKSGRKPKNVMRITIEVERIEGLESTIKPSSRIIVEGKEAEVLQKLGDSPKPGDRIFVESFTRETEPRILQIYSIKRY